MDNPYVFAAVFALVGFLLGLATALIIVGARELAMRDDAP